MMQSLKRLESVIDGGPSWTHHILDEGSSMDTRRLTRSMIKRLQLDLEDQVLTIMSTWNPPSNLAPLACNLLSVELHIDEACMPMIWPLWGPCKYFDFGWLVCQVSAISVWPCICFDFWIWNFVNLCLVVCEIRPCACLGLLRLNQSEAWLWDSKPWRVNGNWRIKLSPRVDLILKLTLTCHVD